MPPGLQAEGNNGAPVSDFGRTFYRCEEVQMLTVTEHQANKEGSTNFSRNSSTACIPLTDASQWNYRRND